MGRLPALGMGVLVFWLSALTVLAVWPLAAGPRSQPGPLSALIEGQTADDIRVLRCRDALERRRDALQVRTKPVTVNGVQYPYDPRNPSDWWAEVDRQVAGAQADIDKFCPN